MRYLDKPYFERRFLMIVEDDRGPANDSIDFFRKSELPQGVYFGNNKVLKNTLYIAHPGKEGLYIPLENYETEYFKDKINELIYLLQALGAEKITISWIKGQKLKNSKYADKNTKGSASFGSIFSGSVEEENKESNIKIEENEKEITYNILSNSLTYPYVPQDLHWLKFEPEWEMMIKHRMVGGIRYEILVKSRSQQSVTTSEIDSLKSSLEILKKAKIEFNYDNTIKTIKEHEEETIWKLSIEFKSLESYRETSNKDEKNCKSYFNDLQDSSSVVAYRNACENLIKSYKISDNIQIELNRLCMEYKIPSKLAEEIENEIKSRYKGNWFSRIFGK